MFKVLVIDDEPAVRRGMPNVIDWNKYGYCVCGTAEDGVEGLEKIKKLKPDVVLLDINMPRMNGLDLVQKLNKEHINVKIVLLSGFAQFEYAQEAIKYGVDAYLLKPIDENELILLLEKYTFLHDSEKKEEQQFLLSTEKTIENIVFGYLSFEEIKRLDLGSLSFPWDKYQVFLININDFTLSRYDKEKIYKILIEFFQCYGKGYLFFVQNIIGVLYSKNLAEISTGTTDKLWEDINAAVHKISAIAVGKVVKNIGSIHNSYLQALDLLNKRFVLGSNGIMYYDLVEKNQCTNEKINIHEIIDNLISAITVKNQEKMLDILSDATQTIIKLCPGEDTIKSNYNYIYNRIAGHFQNKNISIYESMKNDKDVFSEINSKGSLEELNEYVSNKLLYILNEISEKKPDNIIDLLIDYITKNYEKPLKLNTLAKKFNYSSTYLGKLIKNHTGCSFNDYLLKIRIDKSKQMLKEEYKVYEIADAIGFCNIDYFYINFKKIVGISPTQYRSSMKNERNGTV